MTEIISCPHCEGNARLTGKDCAYYGQRFDGAKKIKYKIRVICNRCHSMGKPITTDWFISSEHSFWGFQRGWKEDSFFEKYANEAIAAWNTRIN